MEPNKIEKQFRRELQQREIAPSPMAWDRLDAMLTVAEEKKPKSNYNWFFIAASFLGFLVVGTVLFYQSESLVDVKKNPVVLQPKPINETNPQDSLKLPFTAPKSGSIAESNSQPKKRERVPLLSTSHWATTEIENQSSQNVQDNKNNQNPIANNSIINQKTEQNNAPKNNMAAVDEQLAIVTPSQKENRTTTIKVSASSLLSQVDQELDLSFREKVIHTIDKNYKTVKVALANRNQQSIINQN